MSCRRWFAVLVRGLTLGVWRTAWAIKCSQTHCTSMSGASVGNLVRQVVWNGHSAISICVCRGAICPKICGLPMLYSMGNAVLGRNCVLRKVVEDCLVGWGAWQEIGQGSRGGLLRKESRHDGAYNWTRLHRLLGRWGHARNELLLELYMVMGFEYE